MKRKSKKPLILSISAAVLVLFALVLFNLPKPLSTSDAAFDLLNITDGSYLGSCDNGLVKAQVEVFVENHAITEVHILKHDTGMGSAAESITAAVIAQQSVEVDAISGATMSSKTILKAVETALQKGQET